MHTVERLERALAQARKQGFQIRQEWLETGGGVCEFNGKRWLFIDLAQSAIEQLAQVREALRQVEPSVEVIQKLPEESPASDPRRVA